MMRVEVIEDSQNPGKYVPFIMSNSPHQATIDDNFAEKVCSTTKIKCTADVEKSVVFIKKMQEASIAYSDCTRIFAIINYCCAL